VGLDVSDRSIEVCVLAMASGEVLRREKVVAEPAAVEDWAAKLPRSRIVLETGTHAPWIARALSRPRRHEVIVASAWRVSRMMQHLRKTDRRDAESLARLARGDVELLGPVYVRSERVLQHRGTLRMRDVLVRTRSSLIGTLRNVTKTDGRRIPACGAEAFPKRAAAALAEERRAAAMPLLVAIRHGTRQIDRYDRMIERFARAEYGEAIQRMCQVEGVGTLTALALVLAAEDPTRFRDSRQFSAYLGLTPGVAQSGAQDPRLGITKAGDDYARRLLVSAAHYILQRGPDTDLKRWGHKLLERSGDGSRGRVAVAVARRLSMLLFRLWISGERYEPLRTATPLATA
jgi:transposase